MGEQRLPGDRGGLVGLGKLVGVTYAPFALTIPLAAVLLVLAASSGVTGYRGLGGRLDRRGRLGLHTSAAQASDEAFALANRVAAPVVLGAAAVGVACAVAVLALPLGVAGTVVVAAVGVGGMFAMLGAGTRLGEAAARTVPLPARKPAAGGGCCGGCGCGDGGCSAGSAEADSGIPDLVADAALR